MSEDFLKQFPERLGETVRSRTVYPALVETIEVGLDPDGRQKAVVFVGWGHKNGHCGWHLPVSDTVVAGLCKIGDVTKLADLVGRPIRVVRTETALCGFAHLFHDDVYLDWSRIWPK